jgi:hypothetical protein
MLDRGETGEFRSIDGTSRLLRDVLGEAAGDRGAVGPYLASRTGVGGVFASVKSGSTLPDLDDDAVRVPAPAGFFR